MAPVSDQKNSILVLRVVLFNCAMFVLFAGIAAAYFIEPVSGDSSASLEILVIVSAVLSPLSAVAFLFGRNVLSRLLETKTGEAKMRVFVSGSVILAGICEAPGLLWALCAYLQQEPLYAIGSVVHALGILFLWPDGSELEEDVSSWAAEGAEE